jgi:hypothetical protein
VTDVQRLLDVLGAAGVDFVVIDGVALALRGSSRLNVRKRAAGRAKDLLDLAEIAEIRRRLRA